MAGNVPLEAIGRYNCSVVETNTAVGKIAGVGGQNWPFLGPLRQVGSEIISFMSPPLPTTHLPYCRPTDFSHRNEWKWRENFFLKMTSNLKMNPKAIINESECIFKSKGQTKDEYEANCCCTPLKGKLFSIHFWLLFFLKGSKTSN